MEIGILILGICAGILSGLFGIGGGMVMVPSMVAFFGMGLLQANATSLAAMLLPVSLFGVITYYRQGMLRIADSAWIALGLFCGSFIGGELAVHVDIQLLSKLYAGILVYIALDYFNLWNRLWNKNRETQEGNTPFSQKKPVWQFILLGVGAGVFAGLFGKGGGIVIVPILIKMFGYNHKAASATSLAALLPPVGLPSVIIYAQQGYMEWVYAALLAFGLLVGTYFGSIAAMRLPSKIFKRIYALFLIGVAIYLVIKFS